MDTLTFTNIIVDTIKILPTIHIRFIFNNLFTYFLYYVLKHHDYLGI